MESILTRTYVVDVVGIPSLFYVELQDDRESTAATIVEARGLQQMTDLGEIEALCCGIIEDPQHSAQVKAGASCRFRLC